MPIYEYQCKGCGTGFKVLGRMREYQTLSCPDCGDSKVVRLLSVISSHEPTQNIPMKDCGQPGGCGWNGSGCACKQN